MAHTYSIVKSWVDVARPGIHSGYVKITLVDNYAAGGWAITASAVNPNCSTLYQLSVLNQHTGLTDATEPVFLSWDYDNQKIYAVDMSDGAEPTQLTDVDALVGNVLYCYYEGA